MVNLKGRLLLSVGVGLLVAIQSVEIWQILSLRKRVAEAEWDVAIQQKNSDDTITPDVGTIQFLKRGYSIELEIAKYMADGLFLKGYLGNPTNLSLNTVTLKFTVTKPLYQYRSEFHKNPFLLFLGPQPIGEAQTSTIRYLAPKSRSEFDVVIPNVKQTKDGIRIQVQFTGERYFYGL